MTAGLMGPLLRIFPLRISSKLLLFNLFTAAVLGLVIGTALLSYRHVQSLVTETVEKSLEQLNISGRISRGLSVVFADTNLLLATFYDNQKTLDDVSSSLLLDIAGLQRITIDSKLSVALSELTSTLHRTFSQCSVVNRVLGQQIQTENDIWLNFDKLDRNIADKLIDSVLKGEDSTILKQIATLLGGHRESMMEIGKAHAELWPDHYGLAASSDSLPIFSKVDSLLVGMHTMTAADTEIAGIVNYIIQLLETYRHTLVQLDRDMQKLNQRRLLFEKAKIEVLALIEKIDQHIVTITQTVRKDITHKSHLFNTAGLILGAFLILLIGLATTLFFFRILKHPMQLVQAGVKQFSSGKLDTRIELKRYDEWSSIESALNAMASDLSSSHSNLEGKIAELEENIQKRETAEAAVRRSEAKYRSIFENASEGLYQITENGQLLSANPAFARILGYKSADHMISSVHDIKEQHYANPSDRQRFLDLLRQNGTISDFETQFRRLDGTIIWGSVNATYLQDPGNDVSRIDGIFQDITERKHAEEEKYALERQLRQAQKMEAMGNLAGGIAHDFNNLLQAISGYLELLLLKKSADDPDFKYLSEIKRASERATEIARRLLTFSRKIESKSKLVDLNDIIQNSLKIINATFPKMISIETKLSSTIPKIYTDPTQMEQVLLNLAGNSRDAMVDGGQLLIETETITLGDLFQSTHLDVEPGSYVLLSVTDSGSGMDKETLQHIFEPFFTTKEVGKGTGLGLSIVYGIIKSFKGHVTCYSEPSVGTTFKIYLPAAGEQRDAPEEVQLPQNISPLRGKETILIVDDEEMIRDIANDMLSTFGYTVLQADSGEKALAIYEREISNIDLVILDLGMPGIGGEKCLYAMIERNPNLKIIVASGYAAHKFAQNPLKFGAMKFICKPYQLDEMLQSVRDVLDK